MFEQKIKITFLGNQGVGKTCIISRYIKNEFPENPNNIIVANYLEKIINKNDNHIKLDIWNSIGGEKFQNFGKNFYKDSNIVCFVYDITDFESFNNIKNVWYPQFQQNGDKNAILSIVGNKSDLYELEELDLEDEAKNFSKTIGANFMLISAKTGNGIEKLFDTLVDLYLIKKDTNKNNNQLNKKKINKKDNNINKLKNNNLDNNKKDNDINIKGDNNLDNNKKDNDINIIKDNNLDNNKIDNDINIIKDNNLDNDINILKENNIDDSINNFNLNNNKSLNINDYSINSYNDNDNNISNETYTINNNEFIIINNIDNIINNNNIINNEDNHNNNNNNNNNISRLGGTINKAKCLCF